MGPSPSRRMGTGMELAPGFCLVPSPANPARQRLCCRDEKTKNPQVFLAIHSPQPPSQQGRVQPQPGARQCGMRDPSQNCTNEPASSISLPSSPAHRGLLLGQKAHPDPISSPPGRLPTTRDAPLWEPGQSPRAPRRPPRTPSQSPGAHGGAARSSATLHDAERAALCSGGAHGGRTQRVLLRGCPPRHPNRALPVTPPRAPLPPLLQLGRVEFKT